MAKKEKKVVATAAQIRKAIKTVGAGRPAKVLGYALLDVLREDGVKYSGGEIFDRALDWEAYFVCVAYAKASKALKEMKPGRRIADHVRFNDQGHLPALPTVAG